MTYWAVRVSLAFLGVLILVAGACQSADQIGVSGILLGSDGEPMRRARIKVETSSGRVVARATADSEGRYAFALRESGGYGLVARGRRHETIEMPLILTSLQPVQLDIRLIASEAADDEMPEVTSQPVAVGEIASIHFDVEARERRIGRRTRAYQDELTPGRIVVDEEYMTFLDQIRAPILERIETESNSLTRQWLLLRYLDELMPRKETDQHLALEALRAVPPNSPLWTFESWFHAGANNLIYTISRVADAPEEAAAYVEHVIDEHPDREVRAQFLYAGLFAAVRTTNEETKWRYYNRLQTDHRGSDYARDARRRFDPNRRVQAGKPVPDFSFVALDDPAVTYNNESLLGTTYLIDFWGTWCGPCISEIPNLQSTYDQFKKARFEILSVAMRDDPDAIRRFREEQYPMPWMHSLVGRKRHSAVKSAFEITGYPRPILVDQEGMIVAVGQELRGDKLLDAVSELLGEDS